MAIVKGKGTLLQQEIGTVYTTLAQIISFDLPDIESETFESDYLEKSGAGIPYAATGRTEPGSLSGELFYDPALVSHQNFLALLTTPADENWKITFADTGSSTWTFVGAGASFGGSVVLNDGLKGSFEIKLDDLPTFPS
jgi:hypothetical protein